MSALAAGRFKIGLERGQLPEIIVVIVSVNCEFVPPGIGIRHGLLVRVPLHRALAGALLRAEYPINREPKRVIYSVWSVVGAFSHRSGRRKGGRAAGMAAPDSLHNYRSDWLLTSTHTPAAGGKKGTQALASQKEEGSAQSGLTQHAGDQFLQKLTRLLQARIGVHFN